MTDPTQAATAAWYAVKNDTRSPSPTADPTPYIAAIVRAAGDRLNGSLEDAIEHGSRGWELASQIRTDWMPANAALAKRAEAAEQDAARYRWLRDNSTPELCVYVPNYFPIDGTELDAAIDAALGAGVEGGR